MNTVYMRLAVKMDDYRIQGKLSHTCRVTRGYRTRALSCKITNCAKTKSRLTYTKKVLSYTFGLLAIWLNKYVSSYYTYLFDSCL